MNANSKPIAYKFIPAAEDIDLIIFDLGGVLLEIDYSITQQAFAELGIPDVKALYSKAAQNDIFDRLETGASSPAEFRSAVRAYIDVPVTDEQIDHAWNALIQTMPADRLQRVIELKAYHRTCILSNTNEIHIPCFEALIQDLGLMSDYLAAFERIFYSSRIGIRKPDKKAFEYILKEMKVSPERSLFIDDSIQHVVAASELGIHSYHLEVQKEDVSSVLDRFRNRLT